MLRWSLGIVFLVMSCSVMAAEGYQCAVTPQQDIVVTPQQVQILGDKARLVIDRQGNISLDGKQRKVTQGQRNSAIRYQAVLREDLPWIKNQTTKKLAFSRQILDKVVINVLGEESHVRQRLSNLERDLNNQINNMIVIDNQQITYRYKAVEQVQDQSRELINSSLGGMLQDTINEMARKQLQSKANGTQMLQGLFGDIGGLQKDIETEWKKQESGFDEFGKEVCRRATNIEQQRIKLMSLLMTIP